MDIRIKVNSIIKKMSSTFFYLIPWPAVLKQILFFKFTTRFLSNVTCIYLSIFFAEVCTSTILNFNFFTNFLHFIILNACVQHKNLIDSWRGNLNLIKNRVLMKFFQSPKLSYPNVCIPLTWSYMARPTTPCSVKYGKQPFKHTDITNLHIISFSKFSPSSPRRAVLQCRTQLYSNSLLWIYLPCLW